MSAIVEFMDQKDGKLREILLFLHDLMTSYDGVSCKIRYKIPFYYKNSWICYTNPQKDDSVELVFLRANEMEDPTGLLEDRGRKQVAGLIIDELDQIPDSLTEVIAIALQLDTTVSYKSKRTRSSQ